MNKNILIVPGDGIGQEVTAVGKKVLDRIAEKFGHTFTYDEALIGHVAIEATGSPLPDETLAKMKASDAVLFGAVGHPKYDNDPTAKVRPEQGLLKMRKELGLYANLRPIKLFDELLGASSIKPEILKGADILFFRELTGDIYFGTPRGNRIAEDGPFKGEREAFTASPYSEWYWNSLQAADSPAALHHAEKYGDQPYEDFVPQFFEASQGWQPERWGDLFAASGAKYCVMGTKHHDDATSSVVILFLPAP